MGTLLQFAIGLVFGVGLVLAGMSDPAKVLNFLDFATIPTGRWDASLAFVMAGAIAVTFVGFRIIFKRPAPILGDSFHLPPAQALNARIVIGPAIFGIGWGLAGFCPGPAFVALGGTSAAALTFVVPMVIGMAVARWVAGRLDLPRPVVARA